MKLQDLEVIITSPSCTRLGGALLDLCKSHHRHWRHRHRGMLCQQPGPTTMIHVIHDVFERHMQGQSPEDIELMFRRAYSSGFTQRPDLTVMGAFSGLEIACWDILGKDRDRPVWALLGGKMNERIRAYSYTSTHSSTMT